MGSSTVSKYVSKIFFDFLEKFSTKFNISYLKKFVDNIFEFVEKITIKLDKLLPLYNKYYEDLIENEIKLGNITNKSQVVHIGCGAVPSTSILVAKITNANVIGIDKDPKAVEKARFYIKKLNMNNKIEIKQADALDFPMSHFDVILISHGIEPRDKFLKKLSSNINEKSIIIFRTFSSEEKKLSEEDEFLTDIFKIKKIAEHQRHGSVISVSLSKK
jgi:2-polyprenyl-3-methyl-5-hydroxy-6-metoxy-1,4-benzoquinol methylase